MLFSTRCASVCWLPRRTPPWLCAAAVAFTLTVSATASAQTTTCRKEPCPRPDTATLQSTYGTVQLRSSGATTVTRLVGLSGGPADAPAGATQNGQPCRGSIGVWPDHVLQLEQDAASLNLTVIGDGDTTLVVQGPAGWYCVDDTNGYDPALNLRVQGGLYRVWVGSYSSGQYHNYALDVSVQNAAQLAVPPTVPVTPVVVPPPPAVPPLLVVQGRFEDLDVRFDGTTIDEIHQSCSTFLRSASNLRWVDDINVNGRNAHYSSSYWEPAALCAIVALNARPEGSSAANAFVEGTLEDVPFEVHGTSAHARDVLTRFLPLAVDMTWADDVVVNGQARRNQSGYWSLAEAVMQITSLGR